MRERANHCQEETEKLKNEINYLHNQAEHFLKDSTSIIKEAEALQKEWEAEEKRLEELCNMNVDELDNDDEENQHADKKHLKMKTRRWSSNV